MQAKDAVEILHRAGCSRKLIQHCLTVRDIAIRMARDLRARGFPIDVERVEIGALLHDIGRTKTHGVDHGVVGAEILNSMGLSEFSGFAENHVGAGIPASEARELGLPEKDYFPRTLEEKVVSYADKLAGGSKEVPFERTLRGFERKLGKEHPAVQRLVKFHREMVSLLGKPVRDL